MFTHNSNISQTRIAKLEGEKRGLQLLVDSHGKKIAILESCIKTDRYVLFTHTFVLSIMALLTSIRRRDSDGSSTESDNNTAYDPYMDLKDMLNKELIVIQSAEVDLTPIIESRLYLEKCIQEVEHLLQSSDISTNSTTSTSVSQSVSQTENHPESYANQSGFQQPSHSNASEAHLPTAPSASVNLERQNSAPRSESGRKSPSKSRHRKAAAVAAAAAAQAQAEAEVLNQSTWEALPPLAGHLGTIRSVAFITPDKLITGGDDGTIKRWDLAKINSGRGDRASKVAHTYRGHQGAVSALVYDYITGHIYSTGQDRTIHVWGDGVPPIAIFQGHEGVVWDLALHVQSRKLASACSDGTVKIWDISQKDAQECPVLTVEYQGSELSATKEIGGDGVRLVSEIPTAAAVAFVEDGRKVVIGYDNAALHVVDVKTGKKVVELARPASSSSTSDDGSTATTTDDAQRLAPSLLEGSMSPIFADYAVNGVAYSATTNTVISVHASGSVRIFSLDGSGELVKEWLGHDGGACCVALSPDGKQLMTGGSEGLVKYWNISNLHENNDQNGNGNGNGNGRDNYPDVLQVMEAHDLNASEGILHVAWYNAVECGLAEKEGSGSSSHIINRQLSASVGGDTNLHVYEK